MKPVLCSALELLMIAATCWTLSRAQLTITVRSVLANQVDLQSGFSLENSTLLQTYKFPSGVRYPLNWFVEPYANIPAGGVTGLLYRPRPSNGCTAVTLDLVESQVFNSSLTSNATSSIAIVEDYHLCIERKIENLRAAGFDAVITFNINDTSGFNKNVNSEVFDRSQGRTYDVIATGFPIAVVSQAFAEYLIDSVAISTINSSRIVFVQIEEDSTSQGWIQIGIGAFLVVIFIGAPLLLFVCLLCCCCYCCLGTKCRKSQSEEPGGGGGCCRCCCQCKKKRSGTYNVHEFQIRVLGDTLHSNGDDQNEEVRNGTRTSQNGITSLNGMGTGQFRRTFESGSKAPLFREFKQGDEICMSCAICLEDFSEGEKIHSLPCDTNHIFHAKCINKWLQSQNMCPVCRTFIINPPF